MLLVNGQRSRATSAGRPSTITITHTTMTLIFMSERRCATNDAVCTRPTAPPHCHSPPNPFLTDFACTNRNSARPVGVATKTSHIHLQLIHPLYIFSAKNNNTKTTNSSGDHTHVHTAIRMRRLEATDGRIGVTWHDYRSPPPVLPQSCRTRVCRRLLFAPVSLCSTPIHVSGRLLISIPSIPIVASLSPSNRKFKFLEQQLIMKCHALQYRYRKLYIYVV